jgi:hypothetical protein
MLKAILQLPAPQSVKSELKLVEVEIEIEIELDSLCIRCIFVVDPLLVRCYLFPFREIEKAHNEVQYRNSHSAVPGRHQRPAHRRPGHNAHFYSRRGAGRCNERAHSHGRCTFTPQR